MTDHPNNGGPAFPRHQFTPLGQGQGQWSVEGGMDLRDWFAGQALAGIIPALKTVPKNAKESAEMISGAGKAAYMFADAMLQARSENNG